MPEIRTPKKHIGVTRKKADSIISEIIDTAKEINSDNTSLYRVTLVGVFGSYINSDKEKLGDIDILTTIIPKIGITQDIIEAKNTALITEADERDFMKYSTALVLKSYNLTLKRLKNKHTSVSLHDFSVHSNMLRTEKYKILYRDDSVER